MDYRGDGPGLIALFRASRGQAAGRPGAVAAGGASGTGGGPDSRISREDPGLREDRGDSRAPKAPGSPDPPRHLSGPRSRRERGAHEALFARARERAPEHTAHAGDPRRPDRRAYGGALPCLRQRPADQHGRAGRGGKLAVYRLRHRLSGEDGKRLRKRGADQDCYQHRDNHKPVCAGPPRA
jgi:hypothetical protein